MTKEEIRKFLDNTKVYVNGKSKEIQEKLFHFGYMWPGSDPTKVDCEDKPFLFIDDYRTITCGDRMIHFKEHENREITADEILSLEFTGPSYRPFKSREECWEEMKNHKPFGWLKPKICGDFELIGEVFRSVVSEEVMITLSINEWSSYSASSVFDDYTFADGTPFGIKED